MILKVDGIAMLDELGKHENKKERSKYWLFGDRHVEKKGHNCKGRKIAVLLNGVNTRKSKMD